MPEDGGAALFVVAGKRIRRKPADKSKLLSKRGPSPNVELLTAAAGARPSATVRRKSMELFPEPGDTYGAIQWVKGPPTALVQVPDDQSVSDQLMLAGPSGGLFRASEIQRLPPIPRPALLPLHGSLDASNLYDILLVSEGFAESDRAKFLVDARRLSDAFIAIEPYQSCRDRLRVAALFLPSPESGISETKCDGSQHRDGICNAANQSRTTLFGMRNMVSGYCRLIAGNEDRVRQALRTTNVNALLAARHLEPQLAVVVGNTQVYGGAGASRTEVNPLVVWTVPTTMGGAVMAHEMGHALGLQDEYSDSGTGLPSPRDWVNISDHADPRRTPWHCHANDARAPACRHNDAHCTCNPAIIGTFEGAGHKPTGRFRPTKNCGMKTTGAAFCPICTAHIVNRLSGRNVRLCPPT